MSQYKNYSEFSHKSMDSVGVLVCNLGSPDEPTPSALRRYLGQFLWDPRVIETPRFLWWMILHGVILRIRPKRSAAAYKTVWSEAGSPLVDISKQQVKALQARLEQQVCGPVTVALAMRYGNPSVEVGLEQLRQANCRRILVLPMYPQYSATTTASVFDAVVDELKTWRLIPEMRFINHYHDDEAYISALANSIQENFEREGQPDRLMFSFHGTPKRYLLNGDPYFCECQKTARLTAEKLGLKEGQWQVAFQSRFGREEWLRPYLDKTLEKLPAQGVKKIAVISPVFSADCLETLEEVAVENKEIFIKAGGESFSYIPALNVRDDHMEAIAALALRHMQGWPELSSEWNASQQRREAEQREQRATALK